MSEAHVCPKCNGHKKDGPGDCPTCDGSGVVWAPEGAQEGREQTPSPLDLTYRSA